MIGGIEETSASFEARSAPRSYPTGAVVIGQQFPHRTNPDGTNRCAAANSCFWGSPRNPVAASRRKPVSCCGSFVVYDFAGFLKILALISSPEATSTEVPSVNPVAPNLPVQRATVIHLGAWLG